MNADRLAVIGCGAAAQHCHVPALATPGPFRLTALVDQAAEHAATTAEQHEQHRANHGLNTQPRPQVSQYVEEVLDEFDAAIVATAPDSHVDLASTLIRAGKHVLVEKPVARCTAELDQLRAEAVDSTGIVVAAHVRRLFPAAQWVQQFLTSGALGRIRRVRWAEGTPFAWPVTSSFTFSPAESGGGVLNDLGPHVLDLLLNWFGGPAEVLSVQDNGLGGTDTEAELRLSFGGTPVEITFSRLRSLDNELVLEGDQRCLRVGTSRVAAYTEFDAEGGLLDSGEVPADPPALRTRAGLFRGQLVEFRRAIGGESCRLPRVDDVASVTRLLDDCRSAKANTLPRPWEHTRPPAPSNDRASRVAVTGATGFIGSHIVEALLQNNSDSVVAAVGHSLPKFARLAHLPRARLHHAHCDIRDTAKLRAIFEGCEVVVHAAYGNAGPVEQRWSTSVEGTAAVVDAAKAAGVKRLVHLSSMAVYDTPADGMLRENSPVLPESPGDRSYGQQKLISERIAFEQAGATMEVTCLQPGVVYGPWGPKWTVRALSALREDNFSLPSGPDGGVCNAVHVLDLAEAVAFISTAEGVTGRCFLLSGPETPSWGTFYDHYRDMLGLAQHQEPDNPGWPERIRRFYSDRTAISTDHLGAAGWRPRIGLDVGMSHVASWAAWAGLT